MRMRMFIVALGLALSACGETSGADATKARAELMRIEALSQQLPLMAIDAAGGNVDAFAALEHARDGIAGMLTQLKQQGRGERGMAEFEAAWSTVNGNVVKVLAAKAEVLAGVEIADELNSKLPVLDARLEELAKMLAERPGASKQVLLVMREMLLADRIRRRIQTIQQGGQDSAAAADGVTRDAKFYGVVLAGLSKGDADFDLKALSDPGARALVDDVDTQWTELAPSIAKIAGAAPGLQSLREATDNLRVDSGTLLLRADPLFQRYNK